MHDGRWRVLLRLRVRRWKVPGQHVHDCGWRVLLRLRVRRREVQEQQVHDCGRPVLLGLGMRKRREVPGEQMHDRQVTRLFWLLLALAGCGGQVDPCANIMCSEGRVCVVRSLGKVACEAPDAGP